VNRPVSRVKGKQRGKKERPPLHPIPHTESLTNPPITLLTDFGIGDYFVGAMKGTILSINPQARIIDVSHTIPPQDIEDAAFTLLAGFKSFPAGTIHVAVVDPGVGSGRRPILLQTQDYFFVGPDNGTFSYVCDVEPNFKVFHLTNQNYFRQPVSSTFHGRDIFSPVAAVLSLGVQAGTLGDRIPDLVRLKALQPERARNGRVDGRVIHIDRFGNCITNIGRDDFTEPAQLKVGRQTIKSFKRFFAEHGPDRLFGVWGSAGFLEIAANNASAARLMGVKRGARVRLTTPR
jgi:S-adenosyl-L-methionine hydrolase (adenosine-forming)